MAIASTAPTASITSAPSATDPYAALAASTGTAATAGGPTAATTGAETADRFLKLLVAQLQNQDPLNPMDNAQVTSQMAQINTVTGVEKVNASVAALSGQFVQMQALQGAALVGREVVVPGNKLTLAGGQAAAGYELAAGASAVKLEVLSASGQVLDTKQLGKQDAGIHNFTWDAGSSTAKATGLTFRVTATSAGVETAAATLMRDKVTAVSTGGNTFSLELANEGTVPYGSVKAFH